MADKGEMVVQPTKKRLRVAGSNPAHTTESVDRTFLLKAKRNTVTARKD